MMFEQLYNFRDFGGYLGAGGRRVASGLLFRSAGPDRMTDADIARFAGYGIGTVIDLRRWGERTASPSRRPPGFAGTVLETVERDPYDASHERYLGGDSLTFDIVRGRMLGFYEEVAYDPPHRDIFRRAFDAVAAAEDAVLIHCAAGKDRTGVLVALIHHVLGVGEADRLADYLETRTDTRLAEHLEDRMVRAVHERGRVVSREAIHALIGVDPDYLGTTWKAIAARSGSVEDYLAEIGVTPATQEAIRARYLV